MNYYIPLRIYLIADYLIGDPSYYWERLVAQITELFLYTDKMKEEFSQYICDIDGLDYEQVVMERELVQKEYEEFLATRKNPVDNVVLKRYFEMHITEGLIRLWFISVTVIHPHLITLGFRLGLMSGCQFVALKDFIDHIEGKNRCGLLSEQDLKEFDNTFETTMQSLPYYLPIPDLTPKDYSQVININ